MDGLVTLQWYVPRMTNINDNMDIISVHTSTRVSKSGTGWLLHDLIERT